MVKEDNSDKSSDKGLSSFWYGSQDLSLEILTEQVAALPPLAGKGRNSLFNLLLTFEKAIEQSSQEWPAPIIDLWRRKVSSNWFAAVDPELPRFGLNHQLKMLECLAALNNCPSEEFSQKLFLSVASKLDTPSSQQPLENAQNLCMALRASGVLGRFPPEAFLQKLQPAFVGQIPKLEKHKIASAVWGLAVHSVLNPLPGGVLDLANALIDEAKTRKLSPMQAYMVNHACKRLSLEKAADSQTVICNPTTSPVEKKFFKLLNDAGFENPEGLNVLPQTGTQTDYASWINRKRVLFELDGPSHFLRDSANNSLIYNGQTRLMSALICEEDPTAALVRINWGVAQQLLENKKLFLMFITALRYSRPGAFAIKVRENEVLMSPIPYAQSPLSRPTISARLKSAQLSPGS